MTRVSFRRLIAPLVLVCLLLAVPVAAQQDASARVQTLVEQAYDAYDNLQLPAAQARLQEAIELAGQAGAAPRPTAEAWIMLGVVRSALGAPDGEVLDAFVQGLIVDSAVEVHPYYATPTLSELLVQARAIAPQSAPARPAGPPQQQQQPPPQQVAQPVAPAAPVIAHAPVAEGRADRPVLLAATVPVHVPVQRVAINYRPFGSPNFFAVDMLAQPDGVSFLGEIPAAATRGVLQVDYYLTVQDRAGNVLGVAGSPQTPFSIAIFGGAATAQQPGGYRPGYESPEGPGRSRASNDDREIVHFSVLVGSGIGLATSSPNAFADRVELNPGLATTPIFIGAEFGFSPTGSFHLVPFLRAQLVVLESGIEPEILGGLKARYFLVDNQPLRFYVQGGLGYGDVSHLVYLSEFDTYDTTNEGPYHVGGGGGLAYMFTRNVGLQLDLYAMAMFDRFSLQLDGQLGMYFGF